MPDDGAVAQEDREAWQAVGKSADRAGEFESGAHEWESSPGERSLREWVVALSQICPIDRKYYLKSMAIGAGLGHQYEKPPPVSTGGGFFMPP